MTTAHRAGGFTRSDLERFPEDDGFRYEILDGELLVSPAPGFRHQRAVGRIWNVLDDTAPPGWVAMFAPFAVGLAPDTELQPDVLVAARSDFTDKDLPRAPALAVEVLSRGSSRRDLVLKKERLERAGCPSYWVVEPQEPRLTAWELVDDRYVEVADVGPGETWHATAPYPVVLSPSEWVD